MSETVGNKVHISYTDSYKYKCRVAWYSSGQPRTPSEIVSILPKDEYGRVPSEQLISNWKNEMGWDAWADVLDTQVTAKIEDAMVQDRILMLSEQAKIGKELQDLGMKYLKNATFDTAAAAVNAVIRGAELERTSRGLSESLSKMLKMGDDELLNNVTALINRLPDNEKSIIDVAEVPEEKTEDSLQDTEMKS